MNVSQKIDLIHSGQTPGDRILIATPTLGLVRVEWTAARYGQPMPCNWSHTTGFISLHPIGYLVAHAQNVAVQTMIDRNCEWLFLLEDDVVLPRGAFLQLDAYMQEPVTPVVSGLYYTKAVPPEPYVFKDPGTGYYKDWKLGDKIWTDGVVTGCLLIHSSLLRVMYEESEEYSVPQGKELKRVRRVFETPRSVYFSEDATSFELNVGTSDLNWCQRVIEQDVLKRAGWPKVAGKKYPFLVDTNIFCKHIDRITGKQYPIEKIEQPKGVYNGNDKKGLGRVGPN